MTKLYSVFALSFGNAGLLLAIEGEQLQGEHQETLRLYRQKLEELQQQLKVKYGENITRGDLESELEPEHEALALEVSQLQEKLVEPLMELIANH